MFKLIHEEEEKLPRNKYIIVKIEFNNGESMYAGTFNKDLNSLKVLGIRLFVRALKDSKFDVDYYKNNVKNVIKIGTYDAFEEFKSELKKFRKEDPTNLKYELYNKEFLSPNKSILIKIIFPDNSTYYKIDSTYSKSKQKTTLKNVTRKTSGDFLYSGHVADENILKKKFLEFKGDYKAEVVQEFSGEDMYDSYKKAEEEKFKRIKKDPNSINIQEKSKKSKGYYLIKFIIPNNNTYYWTYKNVTNSSKDTIYNVGIGQLVYQHFVIGYNLRDVSYFGVPQDIINTNNKEKIKKWLKDNLKFEITGPYNNKKEVDDAFDKATKNDPNNINIVLNRAKHNRSKEDLSESKHISLINLLYEIKINKPTSYVDFKKFQDNLHNIIINNYGDDHIGDVKNLSKDELLDKGLEVIGSHDFLIDVLEAIEQTIDLNIFKRILINYYSQTSNDNKIISHIKSSNNWTDIFQEIEQYIYHTHVDRKNILKDIFNIL